MSTIPIRPARPRFRRTCINQRYYPLHIIQLFRDICGHGRGDFRALVNAPEVIVQEVQRQHVDVIVDLLRERICETREPTV